MASGLNGQQFTFHGYLPIPTEERKREIRNIEQESKQTGYTQIFIETPYRNNAMLKDLLSTCNKHTKLSIATNISQANEQCNYYRIAEWKKIKIDLNKKPSVFLLMA
ncbi:MAG: SAM-dependent methyltransferase, partial [Bacteroidia bacterium]|nr:SAM-dependent methyltransferase [Bacteroidia bacterium]